MSQNDFTLANQSFPAFRADLNSALQALASNSSGGSAPSTTFANMWWYDTSNNIMYIRNEDNDAWIKFAELDQANDKFVLSGTLQLDDGTVSAPALTFNSDTNMGIYRGGTDILKFVTAGTDAITIASNQSTTLAGNLNVSKVNANTVLDGTTGYSLLKIKGDSTLRIDFGTSADDDAGRIQYDTSSNEMRFYTNNTERARINGSGNVGIGNTFPQSFNSQANQLVVGTGSGDNGITIYSGSASGDTGNLFFADGFNASDETRGGVVYDHGTEKMNFRVNDAPRVYINASGNLGVGTDSPSGRIEAYNSSGDSNVFITTGNTSASSNLFFGDSDSTAIGRIQYDHSGNYMRFRTNGTEAIRIDSSQNLLVGTTDTLPSNDTSGSGIALRSDGIVGIASSNTTPLRVNRTGNDGDIIHLLKNGSEMGSIRTNGGDITIGSSNTGLRFKDSIDAIQPQDVDAGAGRDNAIDLGTSSARFKNLYLSGGVYLGGDGAGNLLDDYEEGTFNPIYTASTTNPSVTYDTNVRYGAYVKIGRVCYFNLVIRTDDVASTGSGTLRVGNLPFSSANAFTVSCRYAVSIGRATNFVNARSDIVGEIEVSSNYIQLYHNHGTNDFQATELKDGTNQSQFEISGFYMV